MATALKRISISLPDEVAEAVEALSKAQCIPQSKAIVYVLLEFAPTMKSLAVFMEQMKAGQKSAAKQTIQHMLGDQMAELMHDQMELAPPTKSRKSSKFPLPPAKVQAYADTNGVPPKV